MNKKQAIDFLDRIKTSDNEVIKLFNAAVQAEVDEAKKIGAVVYARNVGVLGSDKAHELAREAASEAGLAKRLALTEARKAAGWTVSRVGGTWILKNTLRVVTPIAIAVSANRGYAGEGFRKEPGIVSAAVEVGRDAYFVEEVNGAVEGRSDGEPRKVALRA